MLTVTGLNKVLKIEGARKCFIALDSLILFYYFFFIIFIHFFFLTQLVFSSIMLTLELLLVVYLLCFALHSCTGRRLLSETSCCIIQLYSIQSKSPEVGFLGTILPLLPVKQDVCVMIVAQHYHNAKVQQQSINSIVHS